MTSVPRHCAQCGGSTKPGFIRDLNYRRSDSAYWVEGPVERSFFLGVRIRGRRKGEILATRCDSCGRLDLWAPGIE
jgi:hypothetical protein